MDREAVVCFGFPWGDIPGQVFDLVSSSVSYLERKIMRKLNCLLWKLVLESDVTVYGKAR